MDGIENRQKPDSIALAMNLLLASLALGFVVWKPLQRERHGAT
jgi:hypothetical protein